MVDQVISDPGGDPERPAQPSATHGQSVRVTLADYIPGLAGETFSDIGVVRDPSGPAYFRFGDETTVSAIDGAQSVTRLQQRAYEGGRLIRPQDLREMLDVAKTVARVAAPVQTVAHRVVEIERGAVIDLGTDDHTRVLVTAEQRRGWPGRVEHAVPSARLDAGDVRAG